MRAYITIFLLFFISPLIWAQTSYPSVDQLMDYIGHTKDEADLKEWIDRLGNPDLKFSSDYALAYPQKGLRLGFYRKKWLDKIALYDAVEHEGKTFEPYKGSLPANARFGDTKALVIAKMDRIPYRDFANFIEYNHLKANIVFFFEGSRIKSKLTKVLIRYKSCVEGNCEEGEGTYRDLAGNVYTGEWKDGKQHGAGKMKYADGTIKEGVWEKGIYKGANFFTAHHLYDLLGKHRNHRSLRRFEESYPDSVREIQLSFNYFKHVVDNGNIKLYFNDYGYLYKVDVYRNRINDFADDLMSRLSAKSDQRFVNYAMGEPSLKRNQRGTDIWYYEKPPYVIRLRFDRNQKIRDVQVKIEDGNLLFEDLVGRCRSGNCQDGFGEAMSEAGRYIGNFEDNKFNGKGTYYYKTGGVYKGQFANNFRDGQGIYVWSDKSFYDGEWHKNQREGIGIMRYADESKYIGGWLNNRRHGKGTMYYANGERYEGQWKYGQPNGEGTMYYQNKTREHGIWMNGYLRKKL